MPAGKLDPADSDPEVGARRELAEEVGATAAEWIYLDRHVSLRPATPMRSSPSLPPAGLTFGDRRPDGARSRTCDLFRCSLERPCDRIETGEISDAKTQIALLIWAAEEGAPCDHRGPG